MKRASKPSQLAREIRQSKPFPTLETEAYLNLVRTAAMLADQVNQLCRSEGVSETQYNALRILRGAGPDGLLCKEVSERLVSRLPDASRLLDRLHESRLVHKQREPQDRRGIRVTVARKGLSLLDRLEQPLKDLHDSQFASLDKKEKQALIRLMEKTRGQT